MAGVDAETWDPYPTSLAIITGGKKGDIRKCGVAAVDTVSGLVGSEMSKSSMLEIEAQRIHGERAIEAAGLCNYGIF